ncbi:MAG TPA: HDOD domain-containing protein [Armatimonadota bacterium]|jgi:putative nucleotidyltransferase with HDIG domain
MDTCARIGARGSWTVSITDDILRKVEYLPPLPTTAARALDLLNSPDAGVEELAECIRYDPSMSANVLKLCNSALFGLSRQIGSVREGIVMVGLAAIRRIVLLVTSKQIYCKHYPGYEAHQGELLTHSVAAAVIADKLKPYAPGLKDDLFTTALLHDVGKMVLSQYVQEAYGQILSVVEGRQVSFSEAERYVFGVTHAEVGALILDSWSFPAGIVEAVRRHHEAEQASDSPLTQIVALADVLAMMLGFGTDADGLAYAWPLENCSTYGITVKQIEAVMADSLGKIQEVERLLR